MRCSSMRCKFFSKTSRLTRNPKRDLNLKSYRTIIWYRIIIISQFITDIGGFGFVIIVSSFRSFAVLRRIFFKPCRNGNFLISDAMVPYFGRMKKCRIKMEFSTKCIHDWIIHIVSFHFLFFFLTFSEEIISWEIFSR